MEPIVSTDRIEREARQAAQRYSNVNDACPYPFGSRAGRAFRHAFLAERDALAALARQDVHDEDAFDEGEAFCTCNDQPTIEEIDSCRCDCCGKELIA